MSMRRPTFRLVEAPNAYITQPAPNITVVRLAGTLRYFPRYYLILVGSARLNSRQVTKAVRQSELICENFDYRGGTSLVFSPSAVRIVPALLNLARTDMDLSELGATGNGPTGESIDMTRHHQIHDDDETKALPTANSHMPDVCASYAFISKPAMGSPSKRIRVGCQIHRMQPLQSKTNLCRFR